MNNFVFGTDPLLYTQMIPQRQNEVEMKRQLDNMMTQYHALQQQQQTPPPQLQQTQIQKDYLGELDMYLKDLDSDTASILSNNVEFVQLNAYVQQLIQEEIMKAVKWQINSNQDAVQKIERLKSIISETNKERENEDKKNLSELNDYIKNYSDLTFNEYKQLKSNK